MDWLLTAYRSVAISKAKDAGRLNEFITVGKKSQMVHTAIFEAAADCPLTMEGEFDSTYVERARAIRAAEGD